MLFEVLQLFLFQSILAIFRICLYLFFFQPQYKRLLHIAASSATYLGVWYGWQIWRKSVFLVCKVLMKAQLVCYCFLTK